MFLSWWKWVSKLCIFSSFKKRFLAKIMFFQKTLQLTHFNFTAWPFKWKIMIGPLIWYQICNCNHHNYEEILNFQKCPPIPGFAHKLYISLFVYGRFLPILHVAPTSESALTLKEPGYFDPSHSRRGAVSAPLKISETDWWNIKCVVLLDSYDPPESIGTKKIQNIPCMTSQWRHVKNTKITKNRQNHGFSPFFSSKGCIF